MWNEIQKALDEKNLSIYKLAKITGIRDSTLHNYKRGSEPSFKNMCKIADALDVSLDYFRKEESQWKN
ncbi:helix-turn-helix domain-containing protein [Ligilactobacillus salivarius]|uniref:helix-turn-helix domain-containing protein n=1 Tax=Ligilactobacillus salivarius TaxID=1624 RepID=UPI000E44E9BE|nr:helix-turn-helix transcriptional regulator [Ligilactobacillus salivarius]MDE1506467.1 helix-turn-helix transcriptional regulator [Ligilactobacillus salivarius]MDE1521248.1 helix-turn-helix transcriptional regulator [Ligilactobacillus salivarius]RGM21386.1 XRE family transcriptional regulator [Ligilactobacillus salivarius]